MLTAGLKDVQKLLRDAKAEVEAVATASEILSAFFTKICASGRFFADI